MKQQQNFRKDEIIQGDALEVLKTLPEKSVDMCMTSPPYWTLRDYGMNGQLGLEQTFGEYVNNLCDIFDEVKRVLKDEGTCWVNLGDCYAGNTGKKFGWPGSRLAKANKKGIRNAIKHELPPKCLILAPFRFAIEMVTRGWILRNVIIWHKPNAVPGPFKDRFTVDFEYIFFFSKQKKYYFEQQRQLHKVQSIERTKHCWNGHREPDSSYAGMDIGKMCHPEGRNMRTVWEISTKSFREAHFAVYPPELCEIPIKAGCPEGGIVLDPFFGAGTTGLVAQKQGKHYLGIELNPKYIKIAEARINKQAKPAI
ncbi:MAG: site-specific DNA-methyltransferase [Victivallaceae bacterium]|nr:site-specific DNA-methyltransferase [Victivallaceae bacterium]